MRGDATFTVVTNIPSSVSFPRSPCLALQSAIASELHHRQLAEVPLHRAAKTSNASRTVLHRQQHTLRALLGWRAGATCAAARRAAVSRLATNDSRRRAVHALRWWHTLTARSRLRSREWSALAAKRQAAERLHCRVRARVARGTFSRWRCASGKRACARAVLRRAGCRARRCVLAQRWSTWGHHASTASAATRMHATRSRIVARQQRACLRAWTIRWIAAVARKHRRRENTAQALILSTQTAARAAFGRWVDGASAAQQQRVVLELLCTRRARRCTRRCWDSLRAHNARAVGEERRLGAAARLRARSVRAAACAALRAWGAFTLEQRRTRRVMLRSLRYLRRVSLSQHWGVWRDCVARASERERVHATRRDHLHMIALRRVTTQLRTCFSAWRAGVTQRGVARRIVTRIALRARGGQLSRALASWRVASHHHFTVQALELTRCIHIETLSRETARARKRAVFADWTAAVSARHRARCTTAKARSLWTRRFAWCTLRRWRLGVSAVKAQRVALAAARRENGTRRKCALVARWRARAAWLRDTRCALRKIERRKCCALLTRSWVALRCRTSVMHALRVRNGMGRAIGNARRCRNRRTAQRRTLARWRVHIVSRRHTQQLCARVTKQWSQKAMRRLVALWRVHAAERARARALMQRVVNRAQSFSRARAWTAWCSVHVKAVSALNTARWHAQIVRRAFAQRASRLMRRSFDAWNADAEAGVSSIEMMRTLVRRSTCSVLRQALLRWKYAVHREWALAALETVGAIHVRTVGEHVALQRDRAKLRRRLHHWAGAVARCRRAQRICARAARFRGSRSSRRCFRRWCAHAEVARERGARLAVVTRSRRRRLVLRAWRALASNVFLDQEKHKQQVRALASNGFVARAVERWRARGAARMRVRGFKGWTRAVAKRGRMRRIRTRVVHAWSTTVRGECFALWAANASTRVANRVVVERVIVRAARRVTQCAWCAWTRAVEHAIVRDTEMSEGRRDRAQHLVVRSLTRIARRGVGRSWHAWRVCIADARRSEAEAGRRVRCVQRAAQRRVHATMGSCYVAWFDFVALRVESRRTVLRLVARASRRYLAGGWSLWRSSAASARATRVAVAQRARFLHRLKARCVLSRLAAAFAAWTARAAFRARVRRTMRRVCARALHASLARGWGFWCDAVQSARVASAKRTHRVSLLRRIAHHRRAKEARWCFGAWRTSAAQDARVRHMVHRTLARAECRRVAEALHAWHAAFLQQRAADAELMRQGEMRAQRVGVLRHVVLRWRGAQVRRWLLAWSVAATDQARARRIAARVIARAKQRLYSWAWVTWGSAVARATRAESGATQREVVLRRVAERWRSAVVRGWLLMWSAAAARQARARRIAARLLARAARRLCSRGWRALRFAADRACADAAHAARRDSLLAHVARRWKSFERRFFARWCDTARARRVLRCRGVKALRRWRGATARSVFLRWRECATRARLQGAALHNLEQKHCARLRRRGWARLNAHCVRATAHVRRKARVCSVLRKLIRDMRSSQLLRAWLVLVRYAHDALVTTRKTEARALVVSRAARRLREGAVARSMAMGWKQWVMHARARRRARAMLARAVRACHLTELRRCTACWRTAVVAGCSARATVRRLYRRARARAVRLGWQVWREVTVKHRQWSHAAMLVQRKTRIGRSARFLAQWRLGVTTQRTMRAQVQGISTYVFERYANRYVL